jgi:hypothetical protein
MLTPRPWILALVLWPALGAPGCVIADPDLSGRRCPCIAGWVCDEARDVCVPLGGSDAGVLPDAPDLDSGRPRPTGDGFPDAIFCEDFEGDDLARWTILAGDGGTIDRSPDAARVGDRGLHIVAGPSTTTTLLTAALDPGAAPDLYFRAWVRVVSMSDAPIDLFALSVTGAGTVSAQLLPTQAYAVRVAETGSPGVSDEGRVGGWSLGEWRCVAVHVVRGDDGSVTVLNLGGGPNVTSLPSVDTDFGAPYDAFSIAIGSAGAEVELDDVMWTLAPHDCVP